MTAPKSAALRYHFWGQEDFPSSWLLQSLTSRSGVLRTQGIPRSFFRLRDIFALVDLNTHGQVELQTLYSE